QPITPAPIMATSKGSSASRMTAARRLQVLQGRASFNVGPVVKHGDRRAIRPELVLITSMAVARYARGTLKHDPARIFPGADVEGMTNERGVFDLESLADIQASRKDRIIVAADHRTANVQRFRGFGEDRREWMLQVGSVQLAPACGCCC